MMEDIYHINRAEPECRVRKIPIGPGGVRFATGPPAQAIGWPGGPARGNS